MKNKLQKIPESVWMKLKRIQELKEGWNMMTIVNECLDLGANYLIKKLTKKDAAKSQEATSDEIIPQMSEEELQEKIRIAKTPIWKDLNAKD